LLIEAFAAFYNLSRHYLSHLTMTRYTVLFLSLLSVVAAATGSTAKDVENGICKPVTLIFARGSTETGNMGTVVGPPLANAMMAALGAGQVAVQGVNYPADIPGAVTGALDPKDAAGSKNMAMFAQMVATACPNSKVVLSGYSQVCPFQDIKT
jgi:cutinase